MNKQSITLAALLAAALTSFATEGINLIGIGPVQQGTAGAGVASAKDSTWLLLNPAGLTDVNRQLDASFQIFAPYRTVNYGTGKQSDDSVFYIPSISTSFGCCRSDTGYAGVGFYGTSGMGVKYGDGPLGSETELAVGKLTATYAQDLGNGWSVGAGPVLVLMMFRTDMMGQSLEWDQSLGAGAVVGVNKTVSDRLKIGASYLTEQYMTELDEYETLLTDSLNQPQQLTVGAAYHVQTNLEVALDYRWIGWGQLETFGDQFGWEDQNIVKAGVTWNANARLTLRAGISHGNSPIDDGTDTFLNALFPAIMETHLTTGFSYRFDRFRLDAAYTHALDASRTDSATGTSISMNQNSLTIGAGWTF